MLSIALPMHGVGHANYYLDLAQKDYYTAEGNDPGTWFGRGAAKLGLQGVVDSRPYERALLGRSPDGQHDLVQNAGDPRRQTAWDLTFSAPKSVSVLWALASDDVREKIEAAHRQAVETALTFLEQTTGLTRRGQGGKRMEKADLVFALFPHFSSRALDPQIHTHALLINLAVRQDGTTGALWSMEFFRAKLAAGAMYQVGFAAGLREGLGLVTEPARIGFQVAGVPKHVCRGFSQRGEAIRAILDERGNHDARTAKQVTLDTRPGKHNVRRDQLTASWHSRAEAMGFEASRVAGFLHQGRATACSQRELEQRFHEEAARLSNQERTPGRLRGLAAGLAVEMGANAQQFRPLLRFIPSREMDPPRGESVTKSAAEPRQPEGQAHAATTSDHGSANAAQPRQEQRPNSNDAQATQSEQTSAAQSKTMSGEAMAAAGDHSQARREENSNDASSQGNKGHDTRTNAAKSSRSNRAQVAGKTEEAREAEPSAAAAAEATDASDAQREQPGGHTTANNRAKQGPSQTAEPPSRSTRDKARQQREQQHRASAGDESSGKAQQRQGRSKGHRRTQPRTKSRVQRNSEWLRRLDPRLAATEADRKRLFFAWKEAMANGKAEELFEHARSGVARRQAARNNQFARAFDDCVHPIPAAAQTRQRLTFHAVKLAVEHKADSRSLYETLRDMRPGAERGVISIQWQRLFPAAPKWSPARYWKAPRVVVGRAKARPARWGAIVWQGGYRSLELRVQKRMLFPDAPKLSPARHWSLPALRLVSKSASLSQAVRPDQSRKSKDKDQSQSQSH